MKNTIAIIPARLGSRRIKEKNIKKFFSKPIIRWTYEILEKSKIFSYIFVSTESEKIIKVCKKSGIKNFIKRPKKLAGDNTTIKEVMIHALKELEKKKYHFENVCCVFPCSPFLKVKNLKKAFKIIQNKNENFVVHAITKYRHPPERCLMINKKKEISLVNEKIMHKMTQSFKTKFHDVGQFYLTKKKTWTKKSKNITRIGIELMPWESIDIDNKEDWEFAVKIFRTFKKN